MRDKRISSSKNLEKHSYTNTTEGVGLNFSYIFNPYCICNWKFNYNQLFKSKI